MTVAQAREGPSRGVDTGVPVPLRSRIAKAGAWVVAGFVLDKLLGAMQMVVLARLLTPVDIGLMAATAVVCVAFLTVSELGLESALISRDHPSETDLAVAWTLSLARASVLAAVIWASAGVIAEFYRAPELATILRVYVVVLIIQAAQSPALALLLRDLELGRRVRLDLIRRVIELMATVTLALLLRNVWALVFGQVIAFAVNCGLSYRTAPFRPHVSLERETLRYFRRYGSQVTVTVICIFLVMNGGEIVVGRLLGVEALGLYQIAMMLPTLLGIRALTVLHQVAFPTYVSLRDDLDGLGYAFRVQVSVVIAWLVPLSGGIALVAPDLVPWLFGPRWAASARPLQVLALYGFCAGLCGVMTSLQYGANRPEFQKWIWLTQATVYVVAIWPAATTYGLVGVCAVLAASYVVGLVLQGWFTYRVLGHRVWGAVADLLRVVGIVVVLLLVGWLVSQWQTEWRLPRLTACITVLGATYVVYLWRIEVPRLQAMWARTPHAAQ